MNLIELRDVYKVFKTSGGDYLALKGIDLDFEAGEFTAIMGKSGSGKSTLINMITGIDHPTSELVQVAGSEIHHMKEGQLAEWRGRTTPAGIHALPHRPGWRLARPAVRFRALSRIGHYHLAGTDH